MRQHDRGAIRNLPAYLHGKIVHSASWKLPRGITPSNGDTHYIDNKGEILAVEFSSKTDTLSELDTGQRLLYEALCRKGITVAVCKHSIPVDRAIDSRNDVESFRVYEANSFGGIEASRSRRGKDWPIFVEQEWFVRTSAPSY